MERVVRRVRLDELDGPLGEVARVDEEAWVLVRSQDREGCVPGAGADLEDPCLLTPASFFFFFFFFSKVGGSFGKLLQDGKLLFQPLSVLEEVGCVAPVELVPPFFRSGVEARGVEGGDCVGALEGVLGGGVGAEFRGGFDVVPSLRN